MLNKKGIAVDDTFPLLVVIVLFVIVIGGVFILGVSKEKNTQGKVVNVNNNLQFIGKINHLMNYEVEFENEQGKIIDLIATLGKNEDQKIAFLEKELESRFGETDWGLEVSGVDGRLFSAGDPINTGWCQAGVYVIELPHSKLIFDWC